MFIPYFDPTYLLILPGLLFAIYAQQKVTSTFNRYRRDYVTANVTGAEVARRILNAHGLFDVPVEMTRGVLTDHYDPRSRVLRLSRDVYAGSSVAAVSIAAHEAGHALQHAEN